MRKTIHTLFILILFSSTIATASTHNSAGSTNNAQQDSKGVTGLLLDDEYAPGTVLFKDGATSRQMFNYFIDLNQISFINESGDTLVVSDLSDINLITYADRVFIPLDKRKVAEVVKTFDDEETMLLLQREGRVSRVSDSSGPYGTSTETTSISRLNTMHEWDIHQELGAESMYERYTKDVYHVMKLGVPHRINNLRSFRRVFRSKWDEIKAYDKEHKPDLRKEEDLIALLEFCVGRKSEE